VPKAPEGWRTQDAARSPGVWFRAPASWTAAALRRFSHE